jgi:hypothetical protein
MAASKTILAVAVGNSSSSSPSKVIRDAHPTTLDGVRPYIRGVIERLHQFSDDIGDANKYVIDYRQCTEAQLNQNFTVTAGLPTSYIILGMSMTVVQAAAAQVPNSIPIIGMVSSDPGFPSNVCGVSAHRHQRAREYYDQFLKTVPGLKRQNVYLLHKEGYYPSEESLRRIQQGSHPATVVPVPVASPYGDIQIQSAITRIPGPGGLLILPVDYFFAAAGNIISWAQAKGLPDFWTATDWVQHSLPSALGGYGVSQQRCGQLLADQIESIWSTGSHIPGQRWTIVTTGTWVASDAAAAQLQIQLGPDGNLTHV